MTHRRQSPTHSDQAAAPAPEAVSLATMEMPALLAEYNKISITKRRRKFKSKEEAIASIESLRRQQTNGSAATSSKTTHSKKELKAKREPKNVRARMADVPIRILSDTNPHREGSAAFEHFEKAKGGITIREYLAKFSETDQKTARQWLWNFVRSGSVRTLGG